MAARTHDSDMHRSDHADGRPGHTRKNKRLVTLGEDPEEENSHIAESAQRRGSPAGQTTTQQEQ